MGIGGVIGNMGDVAYTIAVIDDTKDGCESAAKNLDKVTKSADNSIATLTKLTAAFGIMTVASGGVLMASDRVVTLERSTARAAVTQGLSNREMYEYVKSLSSATDSQEEVGKTIQYLTQSGVKYGDELTDLYDVMDTLGDATGKTSTEVAQSLIPAFQALNIPLSDVKKHMDALVYAANTTNLTLDDMAWYVQRFGKDFQASGMGIEDIIATFEQFSKLGVPTRVAMSYLNDVFDQQSKATESVTKAQKELATIQEKLNDLQEKGAVNAEEYAYSMRNAGGDVAKMRAVTQAYAAQERQAARDKKKLLEEQATANTTLTSAKKISTGKVDIWGELEKMDPRFKKADMEAAAAYLKSSAVTGKAKEYQTAAEVATASEKAKYNLDMLQQAIGVNTPQYIADALPYIAIASGTLTTVSGTLLKIESLLGGGSIAGAGASAAGAGAGAAGAGGAAAGVGLAPIAIGAGAGLVGVGGMEALNITSLLKDFSGQKPTGFIEGLGANVGGYVSGKGRETGDFLRNMNTINIGTIQTSEKYPIDKVMDDLEKRMSTKALMTGRRFKG